MMVRPQLDHEIELIHNELLEMGSLVEDAIRDATKSLKQKDVDLATLVIKNDNQIDFMDQKIEERCIKILATQSPLAGDLRNVLSILKMVTDLERIGDHCEDIAKYTIRLSDQKYIKELIDIPKMAELACIMVQDALDAFITRDTEKARKVWKADKEIDDLFKLIQKELLGLIEADQHKAKQAVTFLFIAAHYERIADYATNICEKTVFTAEGTYEMDILGEV